ncbi:hypothetical protein ACHAXA_009208 [Cyclostephanos tholiformis]|uniref:Protein kinase domain-containing protein n=1 Tax=Cyclostephanos tholiformis TaxID=382380 RepID=A0ABD3RFV8_9STRA
MRRANRGIPYTRTSEPRRPRRTRRCIPTRADIISGDGSIIGISRRLPPRFRGGGGGTAAWEGGGGGVTRTSGNQRTLHSFLGMLGGDNSGSGGRRRAPREHRPAVGGVVIEEGECGDATAAVATTAPSSSSSSRSLPPPSDSCAKRRKTSLSSKSPPAVDVSSSSLAVVDETERRREEVSLTIEIGQLRDQIIDLRGRLDEANARNNAIRNNQTLMGAELQRRLKRREAELEEERRTNEIRISSTNADESRYVAMTDLDRMEAMETIRMHLDEVRKKEMELDAEERALNVEKRRHVRALKLVSNEDSSKYRARRKLHDRYVLMNLLGKGGFSEVWRAFDLHDARHVAVKIHQLESSWSDAKKENYTKHVSREYEIHREVRHPRIVSLYDVFEIDNDSFATVLECCGGTDLDTLLKDRGRLPERDARAILLQILCGMRYLSASSADGKRQGIIHYDLKPGNILFDEQGNAKITDFGLSKIVDTADEGDSMELTSQGAGTYWYLPPECFLMDQDVRISNKVDVWSIGVIYFQILFGRRPFGDGQSQDHILRNQTMLHATEVHFPSKPSITEEGKSFIRDCLTYDQMDRPNISQLCEHSYLKLATL